MTCELPPSTSATTFNSLLNGIGIFGVLAAYSIICVVARVVRGPSLDAINVITAFALFSALDFLGKAGKPVAVLLQGAHVREPGPVGAAEVLARA